MSSKGANEWARKTGRRTIITKQNKNLNKIESSAVSKIVIFLFVNFCRTPNLQLCYKKMAKISYLTDI